MYKTYTVVVEIKDGETVAKKEYKLILPEKFDEPEIIFAGIQDELDAIEKENVCEHCGGTGRESRGLDDSIECPVCTLCPVGCSCQRHYDDAQLKD